MLRTTRLSVLILSLCLWAVPSFAAIPPKQELQKIKQQLLERRSALVSQSSHKKLQRIYGWIQKEKYDQALDMANLLIKSTSKRPFELALAYHLQGIIHAQMENYQASEESFGRALKLEVLPYTPTMTLMFALAQVQMAGKNGNKAQETLELWMALAENIRPEARAFIAAVYAENRQLQLALDQITMALNEVPKANPAWIRLAMALHSELGQSEMAVKRAKQLTALKPDEKANWKQLSGLLLNSNEAKPALASLETGNRIDQFKEQGEIMNLVGLRLQEGLPFEAAQLLEQGLATGKVEKTQRNWEILSAAWLQAEDLDKSIAALKQAAQLSSKGDLESRLGQLYMEQEKWPQAVSHLKRALQKGKLKRPSQIHLGIGMSLFQMGKLDEALQSLKVAKKVTAKKDASPLDGWIAHIESELALRKAGTQVAKGSN